MVAFFLIISALFLAPGEAKNSSLLHRRVRQQQRYTYNIPLANVWDRYIIQLGSKESSYPANSDFRYTITAPKGTQMEMYCSEFNVEYSDNCKYDRFTWSRSGDPQFRDQRYSCGTTPIADVTTGNTLTVAFISDEANPSGIFKYSCGVTVVPAPCSTPCGTSPVTNRIVNGVQTRPNEFPWRCAISSDDRGRFCACTIISSWFIMTAAHCVDELDPSEKFDVIIGAHDLDVTTTDQRITIINSDTYVRKHPNYNSKNVDSDIAIIALPRQIIFTKTILPVCLPWRHANSNMGGRTGVASGWGTEFFGGPLSRFLKKIEVPTFDTQECQNFYKGRLEITRNMMCAGGSTKDTCQSDSGGSLDYLDPATNRHYSLGIVSYGLDCALAGSPGIYTRVVNFLPWIESLTGETFCKA